MSQVKFCDEFLGVNSQEFRSSVFFFCLFGFFFLKIIFLDFSKAILIIIALKYPIAL